MELVNSENGKLSGTIKGKTSMTGMLASVRNLEEAKIVWHGGVDIIDIKEPNHGALGAAPLQEIHHVVDE